MSAWILAVALNLKVSMTKWNHSGRSPVKIPLGKPLRLKYRVIVYQELFEDDVILNGWNP
jgi:hypothetical protein